MREKSKAVPEAECLGETMLLSKKQASKYLGISVESLDRYKDRGKLGFVRIGKRCLWTTDLLDEFISKCTVLPTGTPTDKEQQSIARALGGAS